MATAKRKPKPVEADTRDMDLLDSQLYPYPCQFCDRDSKCPLTDGCRKYNAWFSFKWHEIQFMFHQDADMSLIEKAARRSRSAMKREAAKRAAKEKAQ